MGDIIYIAEYLKAKLDSKIIWLEMEPPTQEQLEWQMFLTKFLDYYEEQECHTQKK